MRHTVESPLIKTYHLPKNRPDISHEDVFKMEAVKGTTFVHGLLYNSFSDELKKECKIDNSLIPYISTTYVFPVITGDTYMEVSMGRDLGDNEKTW